jgi:hypothetical protein
MEGQGRENPENGRIFATLILDKCKGALANEKTCNSRNTLENRKTRNVLISHCILIVQVYQCMMFYVVFTNVFREVVCQPLARARFRRQFLAM